ncbi:MAG: NADPH-dependent glutamate synthase [Eubacteriales bacterium]
MTEKQRTKMPEQDPKVRATNFDEVALGYTLELAQREAERCIQCKNPRCVKGCPVNVNIPDFISKVVAGDIKSAYLSIAETNSLPAVCGRVCPQEEQCEEVCVLGIKGESVAIGRLERFCADAMMGEELPQEEINKNGIKAAVIGAGPAGLTCAGDLAKMGFDVTIFEAFHKPGGVLMYGIPEFRLPKKLVEDEIDGLKKLGVKFELNTVAGRTYTLDDLFELGYKSIFIGSGAGLPRFMNIPGESLNGVYSANEYLTRINLMQAYKEDSNTPIKRTKNAVVVGGGNVAMDAARCVLRMGSNTSLVYRRAMEQMPARNEEIHHAIEEGINFEILTNPIAIVGEDGWVTGIKCIRMELGEADASGRARPVPVEGSEFVIPTQTVIMAIGTSPNPLISSTTPDLDVNKWGIICTDEETQATSIPGVYCGGDAATGAATVIKAMGAGKNAAKHMAEYMLKK